MFAQLAANALVVACGYSLLALGFALIYNSSKVFHIAYGAVFTVGAYCCYALSAFYHWPVVPAALLSVGSCIALGAAIEVSVYAPLARKKAPSLVALLSSLGTYIVIANTVTLLFGSEPRLISLVPDTQVTIGAVSLTSTQLSQLVAAPSIIFSVLVITYRTDWGRRVRALRDNEDLAALLGIDVRRVRLQIVILGSALAGVAAVLRCYDVGAAPTMGMGALLIAASGAIVGGVASFFGAVAGGASIGLLSAIVTWMLSDRWVEPITLLLLLATLLLWPKRLASSGALFRRDAL